MKFVDSLINRLTMYKIVVYVLTFIAMAAIGFSAIGLIDYSPIAVISSLFVMLGAGALFHYALAWVFRSSPGSDSGLITSLLLFLILKPADDIAGYSVLVLAAALAMASKYVFALANRHIINPVVVALLLLTLLGSGEVYWWVGTQALLPIVALGGWMVVRKLRRFAMVGIFILTALVTDFLTGGMNGEAREVIQNMVVSGPLVFFAVFMLTEPVTTPPRHALRMVYGVIVGVLYGLQFSIGPLQSSPELALGIGNLFAYAVSMKRRLRLESTGISHLGGRLYEFRFRPDKPLTYLPGQYVELTVPHSHQDLRGNRRYLTIASAPEASEIVFGIRIDEGRHSSYKRALESLPLGTSTWAAQLGGDFVLPKDRKVPIVCIAGGIGVTPFRSMIEHLVKRQEFRSMTLFYTSLYTEEFVYRPLFEQAKQYGVHTHYVLTSEKVPAGWPGMTGFLTPDAIKTKVPEYQQALYYLSGPEPMVASYKRMLRKMGIARSRIKTDYFSGY